MKAVAGSLRLELAQYRELAAFAQFGSDLDAATQRTLNRGARLVELLKQTQYSPLEVGLQVVSIFGGTKGYLDKYAVSEVQAWEAGLTAYVKSNHSDLLDKIKNRAKLKDIEEELHKAIKAFDEGFESNA